MACRRGALRGVALSLRTLVLTEHPDSYLAWGVGITLVIGAMMLIGAL